MNKTKKSKIGLAASVAVIVTLTGCISYVSEPRHEHVYVQPAPVQMETAVVVQDDYVYYPDYQVYYNSYRHQYYYQDGRAWVTRPAPRGVAVDVLLASPSVRLDFHDHPSNHHIMVVREYPKHWSSSAKGHGNYEDHK